MTGPSAAVAAAIKASTTEVSKDRLEAIQAEAKKARDLEIFISQLEEQIKDGRIKLNRIYYDTLPQMMQEANVDKIGIAKEGNYPGYDYKLKKFYRANIAAKWDSDKRERGFAFVTRMGAEDLIKTEVVVLFPKGGEKLAKKLIAFAKKMKITIKVGKKKISKPVKIEMSKSIPHSSLTAWLKELVEKRHKVPTADDLEKIGGAIGVVVEPEERVE
jgi:type III secretion system FlhB-like substrate exporter